MTPYRSTEFEIEHFEPCADLSRPATVSLAAVVTDVSCSRCSGPYEHAAPGADGPGHPEVGDAYCFPAGDTHGVLDTAPDELTGCLDNVSQNGDLDFDGAPYWPEWPTGSSATALFPASFVQSPPLTKGDQYQQFSFQTDVGLSESTCEIGSSAGCAVPPPNAPGAFYPYWSTVTSPGGCAIEFGNVSTGPGVNAFSGVAQYGTDQAGRLGYPEFETSRYPNSCQT
jgi:hypothetical protein